jgi:hypothetical protein
MDKYDPVIAFNEIDYRSDKNDSLNLYLKVWNDEYAEINGLITLDDYDLMIERDGYVINHFDVPPEDVHQLREEMSSNHHNGGRRDIYIKVLTRLIELFNIIYYPEWIQPSIMSRVRMGISEDEIFDTTVIEIEESASRDVKTYYEGVADAIASNLAGLLLIGLRIDYGIFMSKHKQYYQTVLRSSVDEYLAGPDLGVDKGVKETVDELKAIIDRVRGGILRPHRSYSHPV